ncbi:MAG: DUF169 domain-containing protein [Desulfovibrio sp.]|nr:DUF169 domain-containing protein [Desulfovibrio sp.]
MNALAERTKRLLELLGHDEEPFGMFYSEVKPTGGFGPKGGETFSREREAAGEIDWQKALDNFSCFIGNIWQARKKKKAAWLSHDACGCMGAGFFSGMYRPYLEANIHYVSTGTRNMLIEGEYYLPTPESMRSFMNDTTPAPAGAKYCVIKPLGQFTQEEEPLVVVFFARPETLNGLHSLTCFATGSHLAVVTPFSTGCGSIIAWPLVYQRRGEERAVLGGFDIAARKFLKTDELIFSVPFALYGKMLDAMEDSVLTRGIWQQEVRQKVVSSQRIWSKEEKGEKNQRNV